MGRYTGPVCKLCRREGVHLNLKGSRCHTAGKCPLDKKGKLVGVNIKKGVSKPSLYCLSLRSKQLAKRVYGVLRESYFSVLFNKTRKSGKSFFGILELRLDSVLHASGFAFSRFQARQFISHGNVFVNGKRVDIPSFQLSVGDTVGFKETSKILGIVRNSLSFRAKSNSSKLRVYNWLDVNVDKLLVKVLSFPDFDPSLLNLSEQLISEFYSK